MEIKAPKQILNHNAAHIYEHLVALENLEQFMPENLEEFEMTGDDSFFFVLKGMPKIYLKRGEVIPNEKIVLQSARDEFEFHIAIHIHEIDAGQSEVLLDFQGNFNMMMAMMIKTPITNFIHTLAENLHTL